MLEHFSNTNHIFVKKHLKLRPCLRDIEEPYILVSNQRIRINLAEYIICIQYLYPSGAPNHYHIKLHQYKSEVSIKVNVSKLCKKSHDRVRTNDMKCKL